MQQLFCLVFKFGLVKVCQQVVEVDVYLFIDGILFDVYVVVYQQYFGFVFYIVFCLFYFYLKFIIICINIFWLGFIGVLLVLLLCVLLFVVFCMLACCILSRLWVFSVRLMCFFQKDLVRVKFVIVKLFCMCCLVMVLFFVFVVGKKLICWLLMCMKREVFKLAFSQWQVVLLLYFMV